MAWFESASGGGGVNLDGELLWENQNKTSAYYGATPITLSKDINNYSYIKIVYGYDITFTTPHEVIMSVEDFKYNYGSYISSTSISIDRVFSGVTYRYVRLFTYSSGTSIAVSSCILTNSATADDNGLIPHEIRGIK